MSIISITELFQPRGEERDTGNKYDRFFQVITDDPATREDDILAEASLPVMYSVHPADPTCFATQRLPSNIGGDGIEWEVVIGYDTIEGVTASPLAPGFTTIEDLPAKISYGFVQYQRVADKAYKAADVQGDPTEPIDNTANDPFDPPVMKNVSNLVITITRHESESFFDPVVVKQFKDTINEVAITIAGVPIEAKQGRMKRIASTKMVDRLGKTVFNVTYEIEVEPETWDVKVLNQGYYYLNGGVAADKRRILEQDIGSTTDNPTDPVTQPQKLDSAGEILGTGDTVWLPFQLYFARKWGALDLPKDP